MLGSSTTNKRYTSEAIAARELKLRVLPREILCLGMELQFENAAMNRLTVVARCKMIVPCVEFVEVLNCVRFG